MNYRKNSEEPPPSFHSATTEHTSAGMNQSSKTPRRHARGKHKRHHQSDSESDDEPEPPEKSLKKKMCDTPGSTPRLACPFFKCRPNKHVRCGFSSFEKISHVAQHLERQHYESVKCDCPICGVNFHTISSRSAHLREQRCSRRNPRLCAVTTERLEEIKSVSTRRSRTQSDKWVDIYKIIVGDSTPTPLPWSTDPLEYLLLHFISFANLEAQSQTLSNYLADEQEPLESSSTLHPSLLSSNLNIPEFSAQTSIIPFHATMSTPVSTVPESHESNMSSLEVVSNQPHGLGGYINSYSVDLEDFPDDLFDFPEHDGGSLT
ncbi:hypothetical protein F4801DRAFT_260382 [Xylaria longipes]|nr:hypothetical protein F4801DRAFT_260382 [Xylaria longipes]RYC62393.1 hypothetical protein CHU98_g3800 [Xylaria longipes]